MIKAIKDLATVGAVVKLDNPTEMAAYVSFQYIDGTGTVIVEGSHDGVVWFTLMLISATNTATTAASFTAAGGWYALCPFEFVQARKTVTASSCNVALALAPL